MDSSGDIWKIIYLGFEKSQRSVTHDILHYINILTYLLTYIIPSVFYLKWENCASCLNVMHVTCDMWYKYR